VVSREGSGALPGPCVLWFYFQTLPMFGSYKVHTRKKLTLLIGRNFLLNFMRCRLYPLLNFFLYLKTRRPVSRDAQCVQTKPGSFLQSNFESRVDLPQGEYKNTFKLSTYLQIVTRLRIS